MFALFSICFALKSQVGSKSLPRQHPDPTNEPKLSLQAQNRAKHTHTTPCKPQKSTTKSDCDAPPATKTKHLNWATQAQRNILCFLLCSVVGLQVLHLCSYDTPKARTAKTMHPDCATQTQKNNEVWRSRVSVLNPPHLPPGGCACVFGNSGIGPSRKPEL